MLKKLLSSQFRINMASGTMATVANIAITAVSYPLYLHFLGYEKYGVWLALAVVLTFAQLGDLGINQAVTKLVAEEYGRRKIEVIQFYITTALAIMCLSGIIVLAAIMIFKIQIIALLKLDSVNAELAVRLLPYIAILSIYSFVVNVFNAILSGLGRMDLSNYIQTVGKVIAVAVAGLLLYFGKGIASMVISISVSYLFIQIVSVIYVRKMIPIRILHISNLNVQCGYCLLSFGGTVMGGSVLSMFLSPFNKLIIARYAGVSSVPIYEIAYNGSRQIRALFESPLKALIPEISRIGFDMTLQAKQKISQINTRAMKLILFFGVPTYSLIAVFTPFLLKIWFGTQLNESLPVVFRIMLIGSFFSLICVPAYYTLMGLGKVKYCFVSYLILCLTNVLIISGAIILCDTLNVPLVVSVVAIAMGLSAIYLIAQYSTIVAGITSKRVLIENGKTMHDKNSI